MGTMATERRGAIKPQMDRHEQHQALLGSLHAAVEALGVCVDCIHELIEQVDAMVAPDAEPQPTTSPGSHPRAHVGYGGGPSLLASVERNVTSTPTSTSTSTAIPPRPGPPSAAVRHGSGGDRRQGDGPEMRLVERRQAVRREQSVTPRPGTVGEDRPAPAPKPRAQPGTPARMAATELAHQGYSPEEIAERMHRRWGKEAAEILRDVME